MASYDMSGVRWTCSIPGPRENIVPSSIWKAAIVAGHTGTSRNVTWGCWQSTVYWRCQPYVADNILPDNWHHMAGMAVTGLEDYWARLQGKRAAGQNRQPTQCLQVAITVGGRSDLRLIQPQAACQYEPSIMDASGLTWLGANQEPPPPPPGWSLCYTVQTEMGVYDILCIISKSILRTKCCERGQNNSSQRIPSSPFGAL